MKLHKHQQEAVQFLVDNNGIGAVYYGCGTGKTLIAIEAFSTLKAQICFRAPTVTKMIVVCPLTLIKNAWIEDLKKHGEFSFVNLREGFDFSADVMLMNFEMLQKKEVIDFMRKLAANFRTMIVVDESSRMKNPSTVTSKKLLSLAPLFTCRVLLSGTPAPNIESEYWAQIKFLNDGIFPGGFYHFRAKYFHLQRDKQMMPCYGQMTSALFKQGWQYAILPAKRKMILERMKPCVIFKELKDCVDLPEQVHIIRHVDLSDEQMKSYKEMKTLMITEINGNPISSNMALTKLSKLREITSGFCIDSEGKYHSYKSNSKVESLIDLLEEIGNQPVIIWTWFKWEATILKLLLGHKAAVINGEIAEEDKNIAIEQFKTGQIQYLIANPMSVAHGLTLTNCHYAIYYSLSFSWEQLTQSLARIHRISQHDSCVYYYLLARNTIDETIYNVLQKKGDAVALVTAILNEER